MAVSGSKFTMSDTNTETLGALLKQLGGLLSVGTRADGRYYLSDMCQAQSINIFSLKKPTDSSDILHTSTTNKGNTSHAGYSRGYRAYGAVKPYINSGNLRYLGVGGTPEGEGVLISNVQFAGLLGSWTHTGTTINRIRDFDDYIHNAKQPFSISSLECTNPNGAIAAQATLNYTWNDSNGVAGLKNLLGCGETTNNKAYFGVAAYRTLTSSPSGRTLTPIGVAMIHTTALGETDPYTGRSDVQYIHFEVDDLIDDYTASNVPNGHARFYNGETGVKCLPFLAKWSSADSMWYLMGLGVSPFSLTSPLAIQGGSGSITNNVAITKIVCVLSAVKDSSGYVTIGIRYNTDFAITTSGEGFLAFEKSNQMTIHPAGSYQGNASPTSITGVQLGPTVNTELDLPGLNVVNGGTYYATSVMSGRTSSHNYTNPPTSKFQPSTSITYFSVGIDVKYFKNLTTWTTLSGNVNIRLADLSTTVKTYTITING